MRRLSFAAAVTASLFLATVAFSAPPIHEFTFDSETYEIDQIFRSMKGPQGTQLVRISGKGKRPELIWVVGYRTEIVSHDGQRFHPSSCVTTT